MEESELIIRTSLILRDNGLNDWTVAVNDTVVSDSDGSEIAGACVWSQKQIRFNRGRLNRYTPGQWRTMIYHEVAHALTPNDLRHGAEWFGKFKELDK